jgi:hypothetical protein
MDQKSGHPTGAHVALMLEADALAAASADLADRLVHLLKKCDGDDPMVPFPDLMATSQRVLGIGDEAMSRLLKVSRPTIGRWKRGEASPHELARVAIVGALVREAQAYARARRA